MTNGISRRDIRYVSKHGRELKPPAGTSRLRSGILEPFYSSVFWVSYIYSIAS